MRFGSLGATATPMRPISPAGRPPPRKRRHVIPPSVDLYNPSSRPPLVNVHGLRRICQMPAYTMRGLRGSASMSLTPLAGPANSVRRHVRPPSVVKYTPRSAVLRNGLPRTPTRTRFGSCGSITILEIAYESGKPALRQCAPPSRVTQTPSPYDASFRTADSPVPAHTVCGSPGATAIAPIAATAPRGHTFCHDSPPFVVLNTPASAAPK